MHRCRGCRWAESVELEGSCLAAVMQLKQEATGGFFYMRYRIFNVRLTNYPLDPNPHLGREPTPQLRYDPTPHLGCDPTPPLTSGVNPPLTSGVTQLKISWTLTLTSTAMFLHGSTV